jgi:hypothetical protein
VPGRLVDAAGRELVGVPPGREAELAGRDAELAGRDAELDGRDAELAGRDAELAGRDAELDGRDAGARGGGLEGRAGAAASACAYARNSPNSSACSPSVSAGVRRRNPWTITGAEGTTPARTCVAAKASSTPSFEASQRTVVTSPSLVDCDRGA